MARDNFAAALAAVLKHEGGYVDHPSDPGGATNLGITIGTLSSWLGRQATKAEVRALTREMAAAIYRERYWDVIRGDDLPKGLDYALFDFAVNSGPARAVTYLQTIVGSAPDGKMGPLTLAAIAKHNPALLINELCSHRLAFLERLSTWPTFGRGWANRVTSVRALANEMAAWPDRPVPRPPELEPSSPGPHWPVVIAFVSALAIAGVFLFGILG